MIDPFRIPQSLGKPIPPPSAKKRRMFCGRRLVVKVDLHLSPHQDRLFIVHEWLHLGWIMVEFWLNKVGEWLQNGEKNMGEGRFKKCKQRWLISVLIHGQWSINDWMTWWIALLRWWWITMLVITGKWNWSALIHDSFPFHGAVPHSCLVTAINRDQPILNAA